MAVDKAALDAAIHAALKGPEKKKIKVARHEWNVKKIDITRDGGVLVVDGRSGHHISHHRAWVPDDQIYFGFAIGQDGKLVGDKVDIKCTEGGFKVIADKVEDVIKVVGPIVAAAVALKADVTLPEITSESLQHTTTLLDGSWEREAGFIIANIVVNVMAMPR